MIQLITSDNDTEKLLKGSLILEAEKQAHKKTWSHLTVSNHILLSWVHCFENDFESDEDQKYEKMKVYIDTMNQLRAFAPSLFDAYRERMIKRVEERMAEIKI